jgi:hypothetical protein
MQEMHKGKSFEEIIKENLSEREKLKLKLHQKIEILKFMRLYKSGVKKMLMGEIARTGKTYIMAGIMKELEKQIKPNNNYLLLTNSINETKKQYNDLYEKYKDFEDYNIVNLNNKTVEEIKKKIKNREFENKTNIIIVSDGYLKNTNTKKNTKKNIEIKKIECIKNLNFDIIFVDEAHNGGTTKLSNRILKYYKTNDTKIVFITATYQKVMNEFSIPESNILKWDLEDNFLLKNINDLNKEYLIKKHSMDEEMESELNKLFYYETYGNIKKEYEKNPELTFLTQEINQETINKIMEDTAENNYGLSYAAIFNLNKNNEFENPVQVMDLFYKLFGNPSDLGIEDNKYPYDKVFINRVNKICKDNGSRYIDDFVSNKILQIMCFLPSNNFIKVSEALIKLFNKELEKDEIKSNPNHFLNKFKFISINSKITHDPKKYVEEESEKSLDNKKKGIVILSCRQLHLAVSLEYCDIVILMNDIQSLDMFTQMIYRSMTESKDKKFGFVIDLNFKQLINNIYKMIDNMSPKKNDEDKLSYIFESKILTINKDHYDIVGNSKDKKINDMINQVKYIHGIYNHFLNQVDILINNNKSLELEMPKGYDKNIIYNMFSNTKSNTTTNKDDNGLSNLKSGLEKKEDHSNDKDCDNDVNVNEDNTNVNRKNENENDENENDENENDENENDENENDENDKQEQKKTIEYYIKNIIPIICLLTHDTEDIDLRDIMEKIENNKDRKKLLESQIKLKIKSKIKTDNEKQLKIILNIINHNMDNIHIKKLTKQFKQLIIDIEKGDDSLIGKLLKKLLLIENYLIPTEYEKKNNAEVSTPHRLCDDMLNKIPVDFWNSKKKVFEPCVGKGIFLIKIIIKFMEGLEILIPDEKLRYKTILEECIYFSDINKLNIFIVNFIINNKNKYKLNYNVGNTLELDIKEKWNIDGFDAIIGNPPYQAVSENGISKGGGNNLYTKFIYYADKNLNQNGYLLYINPPTYFGPGRSNNKNDMNLRKDVLDKYYYHYINLEECAKHFNVGSKFIYYLIQKNINKNDNVEIVCKYNNKIYKTKLNQKLLIRDYLPYLLTNECLKILDKVKNNFNDKLAIFHSPDNRSDKKHVLNKFKKEKNEEYKKRASENGYIYPMQATSVQVVYSSKKCKNQNDKKVLMSESGYLKPFYDDGILGVGGHCFACLVKDENEGNKIIELLNSKLYKFYIETNKWSGFHNKEVLQDLPNIINEIENINDKNIYEYFGITKEEIKIIEESI